MVVRGFSPAQAFAFMQQVLPVVPETWEAKLERLESLFLDLPAALEGVRSLRSLLTMVSSSPCQLDLTLARGLGYYTGAIFEISAGGNVSIGGGGRYDGLVGKFQTLSIPAVGFSLGLDRVLLALEKEKPVEIPAKTPDVYVLYMGEESLVPAFRVYQKLVSEGVSVELYPQADKLGKQVTYAVTRNAKAAVIIGKREAEAGNVAVKVFAEKTQVVVPEGEMMAELSMIFGTRLRGE
jgi:histidyl-tRNA synthetase